MPKTLSSFHHDEIDSSSSEARRLVEKGQSLPFLVTATKQTGGRGRSGRQWQSPEGGLYFTIATRQDDVLEEQRSLLPLKVAYGVALWMQKHFSLRPTIKWPNDLLFGGKKLGGILCEACSEGDSWGPYLIGVGINIGAAPEVDQASTCLKNLKPQLENLNLESLAQDFAQELLAILSQPFHPGQMASFAIERGQFWTDGREYRSQLGIGDDGQLHLDGGMSLSHTHHAYRWIYQDQEAPHVVLDAGNSRLKLGLFRGDQLIDTWTLSYEQSAPTEMKAALTAGLPQLPWPAHLGAVAVRRLKDCNNLVESLGLKMVQLPKRPLRVDFTQYRFQDLGIDRLAMVEAAARLGQVGSGKLVLSLGTATTVEVLDPYDRYQGGWIVAGLQTSLTALHDKTSLLPNLDLEGAEPSQNNFLGRNTQEAMMQGSLWQLILAIEGLKARLEDRYPKQPWQLIVTGGGAPAVASQISAIYEPALVLKGLSLMCRGA